MTIEVTYTIDCPDYNQLFSQCGWAVSQVCDTLFQDTQISLVIVSEEEIQTLNSQYREKSQSTDVLSFPLWEDYREIDPETPLGEMFICYPYACNQAQRLEHSRRKELAILTIHGIWHIMGYDHLTESQYQEMQEQENRSLSLINV